MIITILGGTGTLGQALVPYLLETYPEARIRILSRGEHRQLEMQETYSNEPVDFLVGDVRDKNRVFRAVEDSEIVFHFAAMKSVDKAEYDAREAVLTNVEGTLNVIEACQKQEVKRAIFTSSDKAVSPINVYGASKLLAEKLFISQGNVGKHETKFSVCRYGNVAGSQGSLLYRFKEADTIPITNLAMTRFFISPENAAKFVLSSVHLMNGGEVFIPKMKSTGLETLVRVLDKPYDIIGERPGEKLHECLIALEEARFVTDIGDRFIRWPSHETFPIKKHGTPIPEREYTSFNAERFTDLELKKLCGM